MSHIPERIDSKYRYVLLASNRAEQLVEGAQPRREGGQDKPTIAGMAEISEDLVAWDYGPAEEPVADVVEEVEEASEGEATES